MSQNVWELRGKGFNRQKRRAQLVCRSLKKNGPKRILDIGCAEGYATSYISKISKSVVGIELDFEYLKIAKAKVKDASFINASINHLPFRDFCFDAVCILEVLEHLDFDLQSAGVREADRILKLRGALFISVPYKEQILYTQCIHCGKFTPMYGHLHSLDENKISALLPSQYRLIEKKHLPNIEVISCSSIVAPLSLNLWLVLNNILGSIRKGYWIILKYYKSQIISP